MDLTDLPRRFGAELPGWVTDELAGLPDALTTEEDRMQVVNALAARNYVEGSGGPFAALVLERDSGRLVSVGVNVVLQSGLSSAHAEVVALSLAQVRHGSWDLGAGRSEHELVVNWRPCAMCYGAVVWSGVRHLVVAGDGPELERLTGFDEGPVRDDWREQLILRGITVTEGVLRDEAIAVFAAYGTYTEKTGAIVYNARRST